MTALALLLAGCLGNSPTFGLSRAGEDPRVLVFNNATEPEFIDPGQATGQPDGRIIAALFDGLTSFDPEDLSSQPGLATWEAHPDGRGYTFHLREEAEWSDGTPLTADDFAWSWERVLHPVFLGRYAQQLYAIEGAEAYNAGRAHLLAHSVAGQPAGTSVRLTRSDVVRLSPDAIAEGGETLPIDDIVAVKARDSGRVQVTWRADCPDLGDQVALIGCSGPTLSAWVAEDTTAPAWPMVSERVLTTASTLVDEAGAPVDHLDVHDIVVLRRAEGDRAWVYFSDRERFGWLPANHLAHPRADLVAFDAVVVPRPDLTGGTAVPDTDTTPAEDDAPPATLHVTAGDLITSPDTLGVRATDNHTLVVRLEGVAPYFLQQTSNTPLRAVHPPSVRRFGARWTRPENIVTSGPFLLTEHTVRDRFVLDKNPAWWGADDVRLDRVIAYSIDNATTSANLYRAGYTDLVVANDLPTEFIPMLKGKDDFSANPKLSTYFYRLNTSEPPLDDVRVRRALALAVDRSEVVQINQKGDIPAGAIVPPGLPGYTPAEGLSYDPDAARALLAEAGYPGGEGFPELTILYNTSESHKLIAAVIQRQWSETLGVDITLENREWKTYLKAVHGGDYQIARAGWIGDYLDPNTFLELWITGGGNNETGWGDPRYDTLIAAAGQEPDPTARAEILRNAETMLVNEVPFIPLYWYADVTLIQPDVHGYTANLLDNHPLEAVWIDRP